LFIKFNIASTKLINVTLYSNERGFLLSSSALSAGCAYLTTSTTSKTLKTLSTCQSAFNIDPLSASKNDPPKVKKSCSFDLKF
jgi:hypothetical protein